MSPLPPLGFFAKPAAAAGDFESIATVTVGSGGSSSVSFSSIPTDGTYKHLQLRMIARTNRGETNDDLNIRFNSDSASNYTRHRLYGFDDGTVAAGANTSQAQTYIQGLAANSSLANTFGVAIMDILDYANTNKYKTTRTLSGKDENASNTGIISFQSGLWQSTNAISSISITPNVGSLLLQYSHFALYGIKGA